MEPCSGRAEPVDEHFWYMFFMCTRYKEGVIRRRPPLSRLNSCLCLRASPSAENPCGLLLLGFEHVLVGLHMVDLTLQILLALSEMHNELFGGCQIVLE